MRCRCTILLTHLSFLCFPGLATTSSLCVLWSVALLTLTKPASFPPTERARTKFYTISLPRAFISETVVKHAAPSTFGSVGAGGGGRRRKHINDESALHRESYVRRPHCSEAGGTTGQLALLRDSIFVSALPHSTRYFEDGAKNLQCAHPQSFHKAGVPNSRAKMTHCCCHGSAGADAPAWGPSLPVTSGFAGSRFPVLPRRED